ncbi:probable 2-oxoglutarate-dependent dioxygenase AOP1 [Vicia villosa]|uniref:probable 2-oxoglutarate-dependent dioxygenase AOP1 n=1 Tax=Vicia villosa TaxID=3911 RepID=UPI00273C538E|nr:probable 2-oxoglutarate-dependent dioxygenase AOP1 [Vicia villosa]
MGSENEMIPCLDFSGVDDNIEGSEEWEKMSGKVREALESYGCFILMYDKNKIPKSLCENMLLGMKELFDLPEEVKRKYVSTRPYSSYKSDCPKFPLTQTFGIDDAFVEDNALAFTSLMWPQGNSTFCETMKTLSSKMHELSFLILKMIKDSYNLPKQYSSDIEDLKNTGHLRVMKYKIPKTNQDCEIALLPHTDKSTLTMLYQNEVQGLHVQTKANKWIQLNIPQEGFVVIVGDILKAWSNGRLHAPTHKVMMCGEKERYSFAEFTLPKEDVKIEVPSELVDDEVHPLRYRSFTYGDYLKYYVSTLKENALEAYLGV